MATTSITPAEFAAQLESLTGDLREDLERANREFSEIDMLVRQTQSEVEKLSIRETSIGNRVKDMEINLENYTRENMKAIYNQAQENQLRLFMMRAQVEQLQNKRNYLKETQNRLTHTLDLLSDAPEGFAPANRSGSSAKRVDMLGSDVSQKEMVTRIIQAQENERQRISRQMHDGPAQSLTNLVLQAEICERYMDMDLGRARNELSSLKSKVNGTLQATRQFIFDLRPMILDDLGLEPTLRRYLSAFTEKSHVEANLSVNGIKGRLPQAIEVAIFRIVQEALANVAAHANASMVQISIELDEGELNISVEDNGSGFDPQKLGDGDGQKALGIANMRQRVDMLGGRWHMESEIGRGTKVEAMVPLE